VSTASRSSDSTASTAEHRRAHSTNQGGREGGINKGKGTAVKEQERTKAAKRATLCLAMKTMSQSTAKAQDTAIRGEIVIQSGSKKPEQKSSSEEAGRSDQTAERQERQERRSKTGTNESVASNMGGTQAAPSRTATSEGSNENNRKAGATPREVRSDDGEESSVSEGARMKPGTSRSTNQ